jgi:hypothetical protein
MRLDAVVTDGRNVESSTKSGWLAAQSMLSPFESNQFNAYPYERLHGPQPSRERSALRRGAEKTWKSRRTVLTGDLGSSC